MKTEIIQERGARPRLRIRLDSKQILSRLPSFPSLPPAESAKSRLAGVKIRRKLKTFDRGNVKIPYGHYGGNPGYWMCFWYRNGRRIRESRRELKDLESRMSDIATDIQNGQIAMAQFTEAQRASYRASLEIIHRAGLTAPLELLVSEAVEARLARAASRFVRKSCPAVVTEFLAQKDKELSRKKWLRTLRKMLERLANYFTGPIDDLRSPLLNEWLRSLSGGLVYRKHHRAAAIQLLRYASGRNLLSREWPNVQQDLRLVDDPDIPSIRIRTWTPEQLVKLLAATHANMIPFTVLQAFAGVRHEEINPEAFDLAKRPLDWSDIDWEKKLIHIGEETAKTGQNRIVPLADNLAAWLKPYRKETGRICNVSNTSNALTKAKSRAGLPHGKNEARNILRKTWISARLALGDEIGRVAEWSGNSPARIRENYRRPMPETVARRLFAIHPTHADILQLPLPLSARK